MKTNQQKLTRLRNRLLAEQPHDLDDTSRIPDSRMSEVLRGGTPFTLQEQRWFLFSPATRERFLWLQQAQRAETYLAWRRQQVFPESIDRLAADSPENGREVIHKTGYSVYLTEYPEAREWEIALRVEDATLRAAPNGLQLVDDSGRVWVSGIPDADGEISDFWREETSPVAVLKQQTLHLEPR